MTISTTEKGYRVLVPDEGMRLTNGEVIAEGKVYLGKLGSPDDWREITHEEAERLIEEMRRKQEVDHEFCSEYEETDIQIKKEIEDEHLA